MTPKNRGELLGLLAGAISGNHSEMSILERNVHGAEAVSVFDALDAVGLAIVPKEPTEDMWQAAKARQFEWEKSQGVEWVYRAMLAASPFKDES